MSSGSICLQSYVSQLFGVYGAATWVYSIHTYIISIYIYIYIIISYYYILFYIISYYIIFVYFILYYIYIIYIYITYQYTNKIVLPGPSSQPTAHCILQACIFWRRSLPPWPRVHVPSLLPGAKDARERSNFRVAPWWDTTVVGGSAKNYKRIMLSSQWWNSDILAIVCQVFFSTFCFIYVLSPISLKSISLN